MDETARGGRQASTRIAQLTQLKERVQKATELIGELRETNYSLSGQVAELERRLAELSAAGSSSPAPGEAAVPEEIQSELEALRQERETIRAKVAQLIERIEKLES